MDYAVVVSTPGRGCASSPRVVSVCPTTSTTPVTRAPFPLRDTLLSVRTRDRLSVDTEAGDVERSLTRLPPTVRTPGGRRTRVGEWLKLPLRSTFRVSLLQRVEPFHSQRLPVIQLLPPVDQWVPLAHEK